MRLSKKEFLAIQRKTAAKKDRREANAKFIQKMKKITDKTVSTLKPWKKLRDECVELAKFLARVRDRKGPCRICKKRPVQCGYHLLPVGHLPTAFDPANVVGACHPCNLGEQRHRLTYREKHEALFGKAYMDALWAKAKTSVKWSIADLMEKKAELKRLVEGVQ